MTAPRKFRISPRPTNRGFLRADFLDAYNEPSSVQESSSGAHLWLGMNNAPPPHHVTGEPLGCRMHLDRARVRELVRVMQTWLDKGRLPRGRRKNR